MSEPTGELLFVGELDWDFGRTEIILGVVSTVEDVISELNCKSNGRRGVGVGGFGVLDFSGVVDWLGRAEKNISSVGNRVSDEEISNS
jgi:hypothetical protein